MSKSSIESNVKYTQSNQIKCQTSSIKSNVKYPQLNQNVKYPQSNKISNILNLMKCQIY